MAEEGEFEGQTGRLEVIDDLAGRTMEAAGEAVVAGQLPSRLALPEVLALVASRTTETIASEHLRHVSRTALGRRPHQVIVVDPWPAGPAIEPVAGPGHGRQAVVPVGRPREVVVVSHRDEDVHAIEVVPVALHVQEHDTAGRLRAGAHGRAPARCSSHRRWHPHWPRSRRRRCTAASTSRTPAVEAGPVPAGASANCPDARGATASS